jgi:scyllo-inositol 2-dehydrogenase (NADP+)
MNTEFGDESMHEAQDQPLRVAVIGYGRAGAVFHAPLIASTPGMEVSAIITGNQDRQRQASRDYPRATILAQPEDVWRNAQQYDLIVVAAPNHAHVSLGLAALEAGLPVVIDKPVAARVADAELLVAQSKQRGKLISVFQNRRWDNDFLTLRQLIADGSLGAISRLESRFERYRPEPRKQAWRESSKPEDAGGLLYDIGSHIIDQALQLFGQPARVYAEMEQRRAHSQVDDDTFISLQFASGIHAHLWANVTSRTPGPRFHLRGLYGSYVKFGLDPQEDALSKGMRPGDANWGLEPRERWGQISTTVGSLHVEGQIETLPGAYEHYYAQIRDALRTGGEPPVTLSEAIVTLRVIEAAQQSVRERRVISL